MKVTVIGNGFDISHGVQTSYNDFMRAYDTYVSSDNSVYKYLSKIHNIVGWIDLENEIKNFLIYLSKFSSSVKVNVDISRIFIDKSNFVECPKTLAFYNSIVECNYSIFSLFKNSIEIKDDRWSDCLIKYVDRDIKDIKLHLKDYLQKQNVKHFDKLNIKDTNAIKELINSDEVITFNYTNFAEKYVAPKSIVYAHGKLDDNMIFGIPFTNDITLSEFEHMFKTTQCLSMGPRHRFKVSQKDDLELHFIGFSFGKSDHYFFLELLDYITKPDENRNVKFIFYYHNITAKNQYISNLREFLGENLLVKYFKNQKIEFRKYIDLKK